MVRVLTVLWAFLFIYFFFFLGGGGDFNKTIIPLILTGDTKQELAYSNKMVKMNIHS